MGYYGVKDIEASSKENNKSDIFYTTVNGDTDSVMGESDHLKISYTETKTPIFTPKTIRHLAYLDKSAGSVGSLMSDDEFLHKGMEEDGSFHEKYLK